MLRVNNSVNRLNLHNNSNSNTAETTPLVNQKDMSLGTVAYKRPDTFDVSSSSSNKKNFSLFQQQSVESDLLFPFNSPITKDALVYDKKRSVDTINSSYSSSTTFSPHMIMSAIPLSHVSSGNSIMSTNSKLSKNIKRQQIQQKLKETRERQQMKLVRERQERESFNLNNHVVDPQDEIFENQIFYYGDSQDQKSTKTINNNNNNNNNNIPSRSKLRNASLSLDQIDDETEELEIGLHENQQDKLYDLMSMTSQVTQEFGSYMSNVTQEIPASFQSQVTLEYPPSYKSSMSQEQFGTERANNAPLYKSSNNTSNSNNNYTAFNNSTNMINGNTAFRANALLVLKQEQAFSKRLSSVLSTTLQNESNHSPMHPPTYRDLMKENPSSKVTTNNETLHGILEAENYLFDQSEIKLMNNKGNPRLSIIDDIDNCYSSSSDEEFQLPLKSETSIESNLSSTRSGKNKSNKDKSGRSASSNTSSTKNNRKSSLTGFIGGLMQVKDKNSKKKTSSNIKLMKKNKSKKKQNLKERKNSSTISSKSSATSRTTSITSSNDDDDDDDNEHANIKGNERSDEWLLTQFLVDEYSVHGRNYMKEEHHNEQRINNNHKNDNEFRRLREDMFESSSDEEDFYSYK
ncbi:hypothetical protein HANVADRAFT_2266 [Hanseniaspora valbyensis NRRL Y-1626]|uniref:Uncharacterized protein n=1 Tax=Hanseniaspora valbyensis NRRL Y-1626 TaxID=766949 RepID=A0A1B7TE12_9ASCO|nr:hypothetical protein HANVADRAFT_2266 [Hanseniaspora valbyensis NRRL Y-1626]